MSTNLSNSVKNVSGVNFEGWELVPGNFTAEVEQENGGGFLSTRQDNKGYFVILRGVVPIFKFGVVYRFTCRARVNKAEGNFFGVELFVGEGGVRGGYKIGATQRAVADADVGGWFELSHQFFKALPVDSGVVELLFYSAADFDVADIVIEVDEGFS